jgi:hypothetical protein
MKGISEKKLKGNGRRHDINYSPLNFSGLFYCIMRRDEAENATNANGRLLFCLRVKLRRCQ